MPDSRYNTDMSNETQSPRKRHLAWCKQRAMAYLDAGDVQQGLASFVSDIRKDDSTLDIPRSELWKVMLAFAIRDGSAAEARRFIDGWN